MIKTLIIIPARMGSKRLPGKPLVKIRGKPMIERVWRNAINSKVGDVYVACCDKELEAVLIKKNIKCIYTPKNLKSGTDRVYNAYLKVKKKGKYKLVINLQGDLPYFNYHYLKKLQTLSKIKNFQMGTLVCPILNQNKVTDKNKVKVVMSDYKNKIFKAIYFSRLPIPFGSSKYYEHVGIYAYTPKTLKNFISLRQSKLERSESLEQLRAIENGIDIFIKSVAKAPVSIDTKNDLKKLLETENREKI